VNKDERMREEYSVKSRDDSQQSTTLPSKHHRHRVSSLTRKQASKRASKTNNKHQTSTQGHYECKEVATFVCMLWHSLCDRRRWPSNTFGESTDGHTDEHTHTHFYSGFMYTSSTTLWYYVHSLS